MLCEETISAYLSILKDELIPATGCTEPIAVAYCAAKLREVLGERPERITAEVSGNILKNVKSVIVPNTGGLKGLGAAVAIGVVAGDPEKNLQVISEVGKKQRAEAAAYIEAVPLQIVCVETPHLLDIRLTGTSRAGSACVRITDKHTNVVLIEKNGEILFEKPEEPKPEAAQRKKSILNVRDIVAFADTVDIERLAPVLDRQIAYNSAISEEGIRGVWGANIGSVLLCDSGGDIKQEAMAYAAAGSDARMSGCELPVVILSGSGNQGITASVPVIRYAGRIGASREQLCRALAVSDLVTVHQKTGIGRLSAYCGAVSAGVGAGAGIAYLMGGGYDVVAHTIVNAVAILSGTICDGAKPSCAAKIASAVDAGILGFRMYQHNQQFYGGDGIVTRGVDNTIENVGVLASVGMRETDRTILDIMTGNGNCV